MADERFSKALSDPRFRRIPQAHKKVTIDKRFARMFSDEAFTAPVSVDKYGRPINPKAGDDMRRFYHLDEADEDGEASDEPSEASDSVVSQDESSADETRHQGGDGRFAKQQQQSSPRGPYGLKPPSNAIYGDGLMTSSDDSEAGSSDLEESEVEEESEEEAPEMGDATRRLAIQNCDWSQIRAADLFLLLSSFVPGTGLLHSVTIFPSDFGLQQMAEEQVSGPPKSIFKHTEEVSERADVGELEEIDTPSVSSDDEDGSGEEGPMPADEEEEEDWRKDYADAFDPEALRKYELSKLKYYYAVAVFDSVDTANTVYEQVDRFEFERSSNVLDCRFVPDEVEFSNPPRETCTHIPANYEMPKWATKALQHTKIELGWDTTDVHRKVLIKKSFETEDANEDDWKSYMASSSSSDSSSADEGDDDEDAEDQAAAARKEAKRLAIREKYRTLLDAALTTKSSDRSSENFAHGDQTSESDVEGDMEITFTTGLTEAAEELLDKKKAREENAHKGYWEKEQEVKALKRKDRAALRVQLQEEQEKEQRETIKRAKQQSKQRRSQKQKGLQPSNDDAPSLDPALMLMGAPRTAKPVVVEEQAASGGRKGRDRKQMTRRDDIKVDNKLTIDTNRFAAILTDPDFAPDPSHPQYRDTAAMKKVRSERLKYSEHQAEQPRQPKPAVVSAGSDMKLLIDSVRRKVASSSGSIPLHADYKSLQGHESVTNHEEKAPSSFKAKASSKLDRSSKKDQKSSKHGMSTKDLKQTERKRSQRSELSTDPSQLRKIKRRS